MVFLDLSHRLFRPIGKLYTHQRSLGNSQRPSFLPAVAAALLRWSNFAS